MTRIHINVQFR